MERRRPHSMTRQNLRDRLMRDHIDRRIEERREADKNDSERKEQSMKENENQAIEEMAKVIERTEQIARDAHCGYPSPTMYAKDLYWHGYRKQSEGEWETIPDYQPNKLIAYRHICSVCKTTYKDIRPHGHKYCHECGAHMK